MTFTLVLDTRPPAAPSILIAGGAATTAQRSVPVTLDSTDYQAGSRDVVKMKLWGDVEPGADPNVQIAEAASAWIPFISSFAVRLSDGTGRKTIHARLQDDVCNVTLPFSDFIDLDLTLPLVTITAAVDHSRISKVAPCDRVMFGWESSLSFDRYEVRVVPSIGSPRGAGAVIPMTGGSIATSGSGTFSPHVTIMTTIRGADLEAASPGDTVKICKVFVRQTGTGVWSP